MLSEMHLFWISPSIGNKIMTFQLATARVTFQKIICGPDKKRLSAPTIWTTFYRAHQVFLGHSPAASPSPIIPKRTVDINGG